MTTQTVKRAFKYRFYPTDEQAALLARTFGCARLVYNKALDARTQGWTLENKRITGFDTMKMLTEWKKTEELAFLSEVSSVALQQSLHHLQDGFSNFFAKRARYPKFKSRHDNKQSVTFVASGFRYDEAAQSITLAKMKLPLDIAWSRDLPLGSSPSSVTVSRDASNRWHISMLVDAPVTALPKSAKAVGIDFGVTTLAALSDGSMFSNPRNEAKDRNKLYRLQKELARKQKGSRNREKARVKVARVHARIADRRRDNLHKVTTKIIRENQTVILEDLNVLGMRSNGRSFKKGLNRAISDASFGEFRSMLEYKAGWFGREMVVIDRFYPSTKMCSNCANIKPIGLGDRVYHCEKCGHSENRDLNAAKNIRAAGLAVLAYGDGVKPSRVKARVVAVSEVGSPSEQSVGISHLKRGKDVKDSSSNRLDFP